MSRAIALVLVLALVGAGTLLASSGARAQVGDAPPPPVPLEDVELPPVEPSDRPADHGEEGGGALPAGSDEEPHPASPEVLPAPLEDEPPSFLPPPDAVPLASCPSAPSWPLAGVAAGVAGGATFATVAAGLLATSWWTTTSGVKSSFVPVSLLFGATTLPFLAGFGAGAAVLSLGTPVSAAHFTELCGVCAATWGLSFCFVGTALTGGTLGCGVPSCGDCDDAFFLGDGNQLDGRPDVYWAAFGAGLGAIAGAAVSALALYSLPPQGSLPPHLTLAQIAGGAALGSALFGGFGGAFGANRYAEQLESRPPGACREPS